LAGRRHLLREPGREAPPRLILRFAVSTGIALALAAGAILLVVRHFNTVQAERAATSQARVVASALLSGSLLASDFEEPVSGPRRATLDGFFDRRVLASGVLLVTLYSADGTVTYSTDHRLVGSKTKQLGHISEALGGTIRGDQTTLETEGAQSGRKVLRTYAPVTVAGGSGVAAIFQDYEPIGQAAEATFLPIAGIFEAVLLLLFSALIPILRRVTLRIQRQMEEIQHRALHDELTGLPNRTLFGDRTGQAILAAGRGHGSPVVLLLGVDRFREINDALGHKTGDLLLQELAGRLRAELRANETLARLGGDEFGVLLPAGSTEDAMLVAGRLHASLELPFNIGGIPLEISASVGMAAYPEHGEQVEALLQHADVAMYMAKAAHAKTAIYDADQDSNDSARLVLAGELRRAIETGELVVFFQPKAELESGRILGAEALVRWEHPERGFIPPIDFIPIAEKTGLIKPLSRFVLAASIHQCEAWNTAGYDLHVSVNLTIPDLLDLELPDWIAARLAETGVRTDQLELEITETTILADPFRVRQVLTRLNEMGLRLAIDDFGTGYSSLAYLRHLPVQTIKIDRSFVMGMCEDTSDATIVRSTIDLGRNLGLDVVAEGVESQEAWDALRSHGCTLAQGYLISKPVPADELAELLSGRASRRAAAVPAAARS
jgi:diguanylate cyclase (GGDEF)-like protein